MLEKRIEELKKLLITNSTLVESMIEKSIDGLLKKKGDLFSEVINEDEPRVNEREIEIEELVISTIARYQPEASYLREILMILKMNNDIERIGDHAVNIAYSGMYLMEMETLPFEPFKYIPDMARETISMFKNAISSFIDKDAKLAKEVCKRDDVVDNLRNMIVRSAIECVLKDNSVVERAIKLVGIAKDLERIADLSTNIGEDVIYMIEGRIIKHHHDEEEHSSNS